MTKHYRDASTGQYTTAADAAARPAETVSESVPTRHEAPDVAELRRRLDDMRALATREGVYNGNRAVLNIIARVEPLLDDADALRAELAHMTEARDNARAEVERLTAKLDAIEVERLTAKLDAIEVERLTAKLDAIEADDDKLSIMFGWLVYDVGEHTCGGYGPESGYAHEPGCGFEPVLRLDKLEGWPGQKPLDGEAERLAGMLDGRCLSDITHRDEGHRQSFCMLPAEHAPLAHDDCMGCTWTDADHWQPSAVDRLADDLHAATALVAEVREWATACATQATDYDEDTEQQIEDGREVLRILGLSGLDDEAEE